LNWVEDKEYNSIILLTGETIRCVNQRTKMPHEDDIEMSFNFYPGQAFILLLLL
jgi:hypothetical protein